MPNPSPQRGDVYWVGIPAHHTVGSEQYKRRPWLIVSSTATLSAGLVVGVALSQKVQKQNPHFRILITQSSTILDPGSTLLPCDRVALTEQVRALSIDRLEFPRAARVTDVALYEVEAGLAFVLEMA
jgi:mRNA-degrading endonuclease toxin of MazEF toxin-antitoxin module